MVQRDVYLLNPTFFHWLNKGVVNARPSYYGNIVLYETLRTRAVHDAYYSRGRATVSEVQRLYLAAGLGHISATEAVQEITWTKESKHLTGQAVDYVPFYNGNFHWDKTGPYRRALEFWAEYLSGYGLFRPLPEKDPYHFELRSDYYSRPL